MPFGDTTLGAGRMRSRTLSAMAPWQAADGGVGRVVTWPSPEAFVLVDGVMLRAWPQSDGALPGASVRLRFDAARQRLLAVAPDRGNGEDGRELPGT
jgi:hypothetical protein